MPVVYSGIYLQSPIQAALSLHLQGRTRDISYHEIILRSSLSLSLEPRLQSVATIKHQLRGARLHTRGSYTGAPESYPCEAVSKSRARGFESQP